MSEILLPKKSASKKGTIRHYQAEPKAIVYEAHTPPILNLADDAKGTGACLGCLDTPCIKKGPEEFELPKELNAFPGNPSLDVCPTDAIFWDSDQGIAQVREDACMGCGLCIVRCPYGALYLENGQKAKVLTSPSSEIKVHDKENAGNHPIPVRTGNIGNCGSLSLKEMPETVKSINDNAASLLVRNILHELRVLCRTKRKGDTNIRIDAVGVTEKGQSLVIEIEFTGAVLESPRALLEDIAVLVSRYGYKQENLTPLSILLSFPNARSEYYRVIEDIKKILGIHCHTITLGSLIILMWNFSRISSLEKDLFSTNEEAADHFSSIAKLAPDANIKEEPYTASLKTAK